MFYIKFFIDLVCSVVLQRLPQVQPYSGCFAICSGCSGAFFLRGTARRASGRTFESGDSSPIVSTCVAYALCDRVYQCLPVSCERVYQCTCGVFYRVA